MLKSMRDITREFFLGKYPFPIRNDRKKPKSLSLKPSLELLDQRIAPAVDAVAQLVGNGMGTDQTPWYAVQGGPNGGMQFDVSEAFTGKDVYLGGGVSSLDIVGDEDQGSIYMAFDTASGGSVFNRMRIGDITAATYMQRAYVGMDFNADGQVDLYTSANGSNTTVEILLPVDHDANPATIDNTSPENTAFAIYSSAAGVANNYAVTLVSASSDPQPGGTDIGSKADGNPDQFVSWKVALTDLDAAWKVVQTSRGIAPGSQTSLNQDSPFRIISFTFGSVTVEDPKLTDINGVTDFDGGSGPDSNTDGFPIWDKGASPGPGIPAGLDVYSKSITLSCLVPPEIAPPFSFQMKEETTKFVTDVNITGSNTNPYMNFSISGTDAGDFSIDANSGVLTFKTLPDFEAPVDSNGDNIYSVSVTITNCVGSDTKLFKVEILDAGEFAPVAVDDSASTNEDVAITISALANDTDADVGQTATLMVGVYDSKTTKGGSVTLSPDGKTFNYTPALNFNGTDTFTYQAMDVDGRLSNTATVTITVNSVNDAPVAVDDSYSTNEDTTLNVPVPGVLLNDIDVDGDPLTVYGVSGASHGTVILSIDGSFTYTPDLNFHGVDSFIYSVKDGKDVSNYATVMITVNPVNDAPMAVDDSYSTNEDVVLTIAGPGVLGNDSDVDMDPLNAVLVTGPSHGSLKLNSDGSFNYTPDLNFNGVDSFSYKANDGSLDSNIAMVTITVNPVNDAPVAVDDSYSTNEDVVLTIAGPGVLGNDSDVDMDPLNAVLVTGPSHGSLKLNSDGSFNYTPDLDYNGVDSFSYKANDGSLDSNIAMVTITVEADNDAPVAVDDSYSTNEDVVLTIAGPGVLANDSDVDMDSLSAVLVTGPMHGTLMLNPDGSFNYTPDLDYNGVDSFSYKANDGSLDSNIALVTITVEADNDAPVAVDDSYSMSEDGTLNEMLPGVLSNDTDVDGDALNAVLVSGPMHGTVMLNPDGSFNYTPDLDFNGVDSFSYKANDGSLDSNIAMVTITVEADNDAPVAVDDSYSMSEDGTLNEMLPGVLSNDTDVDGDALNAVLVSGPMNGVLTLNPDGSFTYTPNPDFNGVDSFSYKANDGSLDSNIAMVTITVEADNDAPVAVDDSYSMSEDGTLNEMLPGVLSNDTDVDGDALNAVRVSGPMNGVLTLNPDGSFTYTPNSDFNGVDSFSYKANDGSLDSNVATVTITVEADNDAPVAVDDSYSTNEDVVLTIAGPGVLANDSDVDMDPLSAVLVTGPMHGTVMLNSDGSFNYTPDLDYNGVDSFSYKANDGSLDSNVAIVTITVDAVNDPPIIDGGESIDVSIPENTTFVATVLASDVDMDPISYSISGGADAALFQIDPVTGVLSFIAAPDFENPLDIGADNIYDVEVMASDGMGGSATQSVHVTVLDVAEEGPPLVVVPIDFAENSTAPVVDLDAAGTGLTFAIVGGADGSFFDIDPITGVVSFKTPPDFEMPMDAGADNSYDLIVQATTLYGSDLQGLQVHVLDVPEIDDGGEPIVINYPENAVYPVVDVNVVGDNSGLTYSLSGPDAALFSIDADGVVSFLAPPDYEDPLDEGADNTYNITVHVSNSGGYSDSQDVVVNVLDLDEKVEAGPIQVIPDTGTYPDDNLTKAGNPLITFPGEEGLMFTLYGPDDTPLIENEHYTVSYFEGNYSITLLDAYPGHDPVPDPDLDPFGTYLPDGTPSGNPDSTADGLYRLVAEDPSGNVAEVGTFEIDTTAPITGPIAIDPDTDPVGDLTTAAGNPVITFAGEDGLTTFVVSFADPVTTLGVPLVEGSHYLLSSAEDTADIDGNPLTTTLYTITLLDANLAVPGDQPFGDYFEGIATGNPAFTGDGLYTVEASDIAGNTKAVGSFEIDTESAPPPVLDTIKYLATGNVPQGEIIGPSSVGTTVNIRNAISNDPFGAVTPFPGYDGEVRVAWADFNNDGFKDMVAGAGPGGGPHIKVIDAITGRELLSFFAFDPSFRGGVYVSADDVNSDGLADLVIGAGQGGGPHVRIFDGRTTNEIYSFFAYDVNFTGGVTVATYDYDKDGTLDIVTGAGPGGGPHVKVFDGVSREIIKQIMAYAPDFRGGVYVAAADFNGNLVPDIITGAGPGGGPHVKIINFETLQVVDEEMVFTNYTEPNGQVIDTLFGGGVRVALADGNGDGLLDLLCGAGPGGGPHVKIYSAGSKIREIASYFSGSPDDTSGVFVGG